MKNTPKLPQLLNPTQSAGYLNNTKSLLAVDPNSLAMNKPISELPLPHPICIYNSRAR